MVGNYRGPRLCSGRRPTWYRGASRRSRAEHRAELRLPPRDIGRAGGRPDSAVDTYRKGCAEARQPDLVTRNLRSHTWKTTYSLFTVSNPRSDSRNARRNLERLLSWSTEEGVSTVQPYDGGIHRVGNTGSETAISVHLYGPRIGELDGRDYYPSRDYVCARTETPEVVVELGTRYLVSSP